MSAVADAPGEPSSFGGYRLRQVASADLVSTTYRASADDGRLGEVALRVVDDAVVANSRATKGFLHVNQRIGELDHPHVLRVVDHGRSDGVAYTATAWRDGLWLAELLREGGPLDPGEALRLVGQVAEALDTVHDRGIVHGTVSVESIWIRRRAGSRMPPSAALTGFGTSHLLVPIIAEVEDDRAAAELLSVAPEQLRGQPAGPASDQYSLACVLFTAVTGVPPFAGASNNDLFGAHLFAEIPSVDDVRDDLDSRWDDVFARALDKEPAQRYGSCRELVVAAGRRTAGGAPARPPSTRQPLGLPTSPPDGPATGSRHGEGSLAPPAARPDDQRRDRRSRRRNADATGDTPDRNARRRKTILVVLVIIVAIIATVRVMQAAALAG